jgi:hypothetical protein
MENIIEKNFQDVFIGIPQDDKYGLYIQLIS